MTRSPLGSRGASFPRIFASLLFLLLIGSKQYYSVQTVTRRSFYYYLYWHSHSGQKRDKSPVKGREEASYRYHHTTLGRRPMLTVPYAFRPEMCRTLERYCRLRNSTNCAIAIACCTSTLFLLREIGRNNNTCLVRQYYRTGKCTASS